MGEQEEEEEERRAKRARRDLSLSTRFTNQPTFIFLFFLPFYNNNLGTARAPLFPFPFFPFSTSLLVCGDAPDADGSTYAVATTGRCV